MTSLSNPDSSRLMSSAGELSPARQELPIHYAELESIYSQTIDRGLRSVAVMSCNGGEGVTTLACALAKRAQAGGHRTLLVDMNFCRPMIANLMMEPLTADSAMSAPEHRWNNLDQHLINEIEITREADLAILPAPSSPTGNLMLREKHYLARCMEAWLEQYEVVIIDTSPINAINRHNLPAERIASECEGALLTVMAGVTQQSHLQAAMSRLRSLDVRLSGCVYNDMVSPGLGDELIRETYRLQRWLPRLMGWLRDKVAHASLLNMSV